MSNSTRSNLQVIGTTALLILLLLLASALLGCARFSTTQTDISYDSQGKPQRSITTRASAHTLFSAKSQLTNWKATQTDKTQGATVGGLSQESTGTNIANIFEAIGRGVVSGLATGVK